MSTLIATDQSDNGQPSDSRRNRRYLTPPQWLQENPKTIGRTLFYQSLRNGQIPAIKVGRRYLIPEDLLDQIMND